MELVCDFWKECKASGGCPHSIRHERIKGNDWCPVEGGGQGWCMISMRFRHCRHAKRGEGATPVKKKKFKPPKQEELF